jgi:glycosyltransferase involved in cell wall biosynthesis
VQHVAVRVLQVVAADRWTGAAATALQLAEALQRAGVDCQLIFRPGNNLEQRLCGVPWCHPVLARERSPADLRAALEELRALAQGAAVVHAHLPHDHALVRLALAGSSVRVVRSIRHPKHLRPDPFQRWLYRGTAAAGLANSTMAPACRRIPALAATPRAVLPAAVEDRFLAVGQQRASGAHDSGRERVRSSLAIPSEAVVAGSVGKLDRGRGQDLLLHALAAVPDVWGLVVGHGPWEEKLRRRARALGVAERVVFAGYVDAGLEELYQAMDLFIFPAAGSDWGHRAIAEAAASSLPSLAADLPGVRDLITVGVTGDLFAAEDAAALALLLRQWAGDAARRLAAGRAAAARASAEWTPRRLAAVALDLYRRAGVG